VENEEVKWRNGEKQKKRIKNKEKRNRRVKVGKS
jgi:hypothetical protein